MKKIDKLFEDFPELKLIKSKIISSMSKKKKSPFFNLFQRYRIRLSKMDKKAIKAIQQRSNSDELIWGFMYCDMCFEGNFYFWYLNKLIEKTKNLTGFNGAIKNLLNIGQFTDTISEFEINAFFNNYHPSFDSKIKHSSLKLDSVMKLDKRNVFFEILTPHNTIPADGIARKIKNTVKGKIKDKIIRQIKVCSENEKKPVVLFVNISHCGHIKHQIRDAFLGLGQYKLTFNKLTGDVVSTTFERKTNGLNKEEVDSQHLSAIVFYSRKIFGFKVDTFEKDIIINQHANYKLTPIELKKIKRFDLRKL